LRKAAEGNHAEAQLSLGRCYFEGWDVRKDLAEAFRWWRKAADQDLAEAQSNVGVCYMSGQGVATNYVEAVKWLRKAADQNIVLAQYNLGSCYHTGQGVAKDYVEAVKWFRRSAEQGYALAQYNLGACYAKGQGVGKDEVEAYKWWLLAGAQGLEAARQNMAALERQLTREQLIEGQKRAGDFTLPEAPSLATQQGEAEDNPLADLRAKAATGDAQAQNELGEALYAGKLGAVKNAVEAVKWFRRAAEQNLAAAQSNLGICYERGDGVPKYDVEAYKWGLLAAAQGDTKAKRNASLLQLLLSSEEIVEGKRRAQAWLEQRKKASTNNQ
jgi:hypothetical protein